MKAEFINPFLSECQSIFREVAGVDLTYKGTEVAKSTVATKEVVIVIGITGNLRGCVAINLDREFAMKVASNMMGGMKVSELNELSKSAISELCNMIMGRVSTAFSLKNINTDITPPSIMTGEKIELSVSNMPLLSIKFGYEKYVLDFEISITES